MRLLALAFGLGVLTDAVIAQYYIAIGERRIFAAAVLSIIVTAIPFIVTERAINKRRVSVFIAYALGCGLGTALGLLITI